MNAETRLGVTLLLGGFDVAAWFGWAPFMQPGSPSFGELAVLWGLAAVGVAGMALGALFLYADSPAQREKDEARRAVAERHNEMCRRYVEAAERRRRAGEARP